jgi:predicted amidohydrolase YtcJ
MEMRIMSEKFDLIVVGSIRTFSKETPFAGAMGIRAGRVAALGSPQELAALADTGTRVLQLPGKTILPGLYDTHIHGLSTALMISGVNLSEAGSVAEILALIRARVAKTPPGQIVFAMMFNYETVAEYRFPTRQELDAISLEHPIMVLHQDAHSCAGNSLLLERCDIAAGMIGVEVDGSGELTGKVSDPTIMDIHLRTSIDENHDLLGCIDVLVAEALKNGLTSITLKEFPSIILQLLENEERFPVNLDFMTMYHEWQIPELEAILAREELRQRVAICFFADGATDTRTAAYSNPYADDPDNYGKRVYADAQLLPLIEKVHRAGFQVSVHACGDAAIEQVLGLYERVLARYPRADHRHRIEHFESPTVNQIKRAARLGIGLAMQPEVVFFFGEETPEVMIPVMGQVNFERSFPFRTLLDEGCLVAGGSDAPINSLNPFSGIQALLLNSIEKYRITLTEAIEIYASTAAKINFSEKQRGMLKPGMQADFIVLNRDPYRTRPQELKNIQVEQTYVKGRAVFAAEELDRRALSA